MPWNDALETQKRASLYSFKTNFSTSNPPCLGQVGQTSLRQDRKKRYIILAGIKWIILQTRLHGRGNFAFSLVYTDILWLSHSYSTLCNVHMICFVEILPRTEA